MGAFGLAVLALTISVLLSAPAQARTRDRGGTHVVDSAAQGNQRDPRNPGSAERLMLGLGVRNVSPAAVIHTASFPSPALRQDFLAG